MGIMPPFYTPCYIEIRGSVLGGLWLIGGAGAVAFTILFSLLGKHGYTEREAPRVDVAFWQDLATDGGWWPATPEQPPSYCGTNFTSASSGGRVWGSESIGCLLPADAEGRLVYPFSNEVRVAFSVAFGRDPQYNASEVLFYQGVENVTLGLQVSFSTSHEAMPHVSTCKVFGPPSETHLEGREIPSRYNELHPKHNYGEGFLLLSIEDIVQAAGRELMDAGSEDAPLRLAGLEVVTRVDIRNYHVPFRWPFDAWNPLGLVPASALECKVRFAVLRDQFTPVRWFYDKMTPVALQHGLRLTVAGTGSVGRFSTAELLEKLLMGFAAFGCAQAALDLAWYYLHPKSEVIARRAFLPLELKAGGRRDAAKRKD